MTSLNFATHGNADKPAVMLLHGFMSCNAQWMLNIDALAEHFYLVTVELWGHGDSPTPQDESFYTIECYIEQFETIRTQLGISNWAVIGQSYGAGVILRYANQHQDVCRAVIATNSRSAFSTVLGSEEAQRRAFPDRPNLRRLPYHPIHARRFPEDVKAALVEKADAMSPDAVRLGGNLGATLNCRELVKTFPLPLLIVNGKFEKSFQTDLSSLKSEAPHLNIVDLDGGHSVNIEAAQGFNTAALTFLQ